MRNLKKILALALVFAMAFTFTAGAAVDFTDAASINADYADDVNMLVELGVIAGYPDGSFGPAKNITRAEFAKMAYTIIYGSDTDGNLFAAQKSNFWDVEGNASVAWAKGYINYCANQKIVSGVGGGKFNPSGNITVAEASKMLLVILGCDPAKEGFTGANWMSNVVAKAMELGVYDGWKGDPAALATRELVAKLMANTILSSVYTYSSITGIGSQKDALGQNWNDTLGEKTMGLKTVTGIVVANELYELATDEEGMTLVTKGNLSDPLTEVEYNGAAIAATGVDSEESMILYTAIDSDGDEYTSTMTIDRALPDELLGAKVNVFFKADKKESSTSGRIDYKNIEVIGDVIVNADTVIYEVPALNVDVYPNGESSSTTKIQPYIGITTDDGEVKIELDRKTVAREAKENDAQDNGDVIDEINKRAYINDASSSMADGSFVLCGDSTFVDGLGVNAAGKVDASNYRFVSVDGGETYSYFFKLNNADTLKYGAVTAYSEARGTIKVTNLTAMDLEDVVLNDEIAIDDYVVVYKANGKYNISKVDVVTGALDALGDDASATIGGNKYWAWNGYNFDGNTKFSTFYNTYRAAMGANTKYYTYGNLILDIDYDEAAAVADDYAVVLESYVDRGTAYVRLGFADNTEGTYAVGKFFQTNPAEPNDDANDRPADFAKNAMFGMVVAYKILDNGTVDLSGQYFNETDSTKTTLKVVADVTIADKKFDDKRGLNDETVVFALYGDLIYGADGNVDYNDPDTVGVKSKAYKLSELKSLTTSKVHGLVAPVTPSAVYNPSLAGNFGYYVVNSLNSANQYIVAASAMIGDKVATGAASFTKGKDWGYIVEANQVYDFVAGTSYANLKVIDSEGLHEYKTVVDVTTYASAPLLTEKETQKLDGKPDHFDGSGNADHWNPLWNGKFVTYDLNAEGEIAMMDMLAVDGAPTVSPSMDKNSKFFYVNVVRVRGDVLYYYGNADVANVENTAPATIDLHEDGYKVISILEGEYNGDTLTTISAQQDSINVAPNADGCNAIIETYEGKVRAIYSFAD